jgi:hypothetical protein
MIWVYDPDLVLLRKFVLGDVDEAGSKQRPEEEKHTLLLRIFFIAVPIVCIFHFE